MTKKAWKHLGDKNWCQNCKRKINIMAFRSEGYCSDNCRKELGLGPKETYRGRSA